MPHAPQTLFGPSGGEVAWPVKSIAHPYRRETDPRIEPCLSPALAWFTLPDHKIHYPYRNGGNVENRRKTIVINKAFQYQYSLLSASIAVLLVNGFFIAKLLFPGESPLTVTTDAFLAIGAIELLLVVSIWYFVLRATHRVAGPVHVFTRAIGRLGQGDLTTTVSLRESDMFREEGDTMNASIAELRNKVEAIKTIVAQAEEAHEAGNELSALLSQLHQQLSELTTSGKEV